MTLRTVLLVLLSASCCCTYTRLETVFKALHQLIPGHGHWDEVTTLKDAYLQQRSKGVQYDPDSLPYFKFIPKYLATVTPGGERIPLEGREGCAHPAWVSSRVVESGAVEVTVHMEDSVVTGCYVGMVLATDKHVILRELLWATDHVFSFPAPSSPNPAEEWDLYERGPRLFIYTSFLEETTANLAATLALFEPCLTQGVGDIFATLNREFLEAFAGITMAEREAPEILEVPAEMIKNGDTFNIMRLDGLDPMIAWAMGAATGHTAVALWRDGQLQVCESNALSPYWPRNGIQCNPYIDWLEFGRLAGYNTVLAPLSEERSRAMNMTRAWQMVDSVMGVDYGFEVVLTGLLDTLYDNLPCADKARSHCLQPEHLELLASYLERVSSEAARIIKPALMQRAGVDFDHPTGVLEAYYQAHLQGVQATHLALMPEQDGWLYATTRNGEPGLSPAMICNVFVCNVWKAAGVFSDIGDQFNCGETSVNDNYRLALYSTAEPPHMCNQVDPENPLCQVLGKYSLRLDSQPGVLPRYNYVQPKEGMLENCPSLAPDYLAPTNC